MKTFKQFQESCCRECDDSLYGIVEEDFEVTGDEEYEDWGEPEEETFEINETAQAGLAAKAAKSGISIDTLRKVYQRGVAAWNSGHRPGTTPQQWGMARVNSYITKGKGTYGGADKDLHEGDTSDLRRVAKDKESGLPKKYVAGLSSSTAKARAAHWNKMDKLSDSDPRAYEPAPGDATAKTKLSKHTLKYRSMFGEDINDELLEACWDGYKQVGTKMKNGKAVPNCVPVNEENKPNVKLGKPFLTPGGPKKRAVYVKNDKGNIVKVNFGDPHLEIKRDNPARRSNFRARHHCESPGPRWKAKYWSCKFWSTTPVSKLD